jgi:hypothetical protein
MMLDAQADLARRAWLPCIHCGDTPLYLLDYESTWSGCSAGPAYAAGGTTLVSASNGTPNTCCASCSTTPSQRPPAVPAKGVTGDCLSDWCLT